MNCHQTARADTHALSPHRVQPMFGQRLQPVYFFEKAVAAAAIQVQLESASLQVDMQTKMAVVTSTKDAIETLMKNQ